MRYCVIILMITVLLIPVTSSAHCDTMEGPVIKDAKIALEKGDVTPVLRWLKPEYENQITELFKKTLLVRVKSSEAKELADMYFFETLVRLHRAGEGEAYTGLKSTPVEPIVAMSDQSLVTGKIDELIEDLASETAKTINKLLSSVLEKKKLADTSVEAGREYVEAYVQFMHFVENLHEAISGSASDQHQHKP